MKLTKKNFVAFLEKIGACRPGIARVKRCKNVRTLITRAVASEEKAKFIKMTRYGRRLADSAWLFNKLNARACTGIRTYFSDVRVTNPEVVSAEAIITLLKAETI